MKGEKSKKRTLVINGQNFYLVVGKTFVTTTIPHENREDQRPLRQTVDSLCEAISDLMVILNPPEEESAPGS
jgi:hypothetical protein